MLVRLIKAFRGWRPGEELELPAATALAWVAIGAAEAVEPVAPIEAAVIEAPEKAVLERPRARR